MTTTYSATICGITPLLLHKFSAANEVNEGKGTRRIHIKEEDPREAAEKVCYRDKNNVVYIPGQCVARMLCEAGSAYKQRGSRKSLKFIVPTAIDVLEEELILRDEEGNPITQFEVDSRPVVIPSTKGRVIRHRPRFNSWALQVSINIDEENLSAETILTLLTDGGKKFGLGDYRPQKGGPFGRFQVVQWSVLAGSREDEHKLAAE